MYLTLWEEVVKPYGEANPSVDVSIGLSGKKAMVYTERGRFWFTRKQYPLIAIEQLPGEITMELFEEAAAHPGLLESVTEKVEFFRSLIPEQELPWEVQVERDDLSVLTAKEKLIGMLYGVNATVRRDGTKAVILPKHLDIISPNKPRSRSAAMKKISENVLVRMPNGSDRKGRMFAGREELLREYPEAEDIYKAHPKLLEEAKRIRGIVEHIPYSEFLFLKNSAETERDKTELERLRKIEKEKLKRGNQIEQLAQETISRIHQHATDSISRINQRVMDSELPIQPEPSSPPKDEEIRTRIYGNIKVVVPKQDDRESHVEVFTDLEAKMMETIDMTPDVARALNLKSLETNRMGKRGYGYAANIAGRDVTVYANSMFRVQEGRFLPEINRMTFTAFDLLFDKSVRNLHDELIPDYLGLIDNVDGIKFDKEDRAIEVPRRGFMSRKFIEGFGRYLAQVEMLETRTGKLSRINRARMDMDSDDMATQRKGRYDLPNRFRYYTPKRVKMDSKILGEALADAMECHVFYFHDL
jgi:hypothetical protein